MVRDVGAGRWRPTSPAQLGRAWRGTGESPVSREVRTFINERAVAVPAGATVADAVARHDRTLTRALADGTAYVTDGVGRRVDPATRVVAGAIFRVVRSARVAGGSGANA